jgi:hypothetical protein
MEKNKKIELLLVILILLVVCIFSLGDSIETPEDSGFGLHEFGSLIGKRKITIYYEDDYPVECIIRNENGEFEWVTKCASDYKDFIEGIEGNEDRPGGIELWNIAAGYELLDWEVVEDPMLAMVIIKIDYDTTKGIGYCKAPEYDEDGNLVRSGYIKINVYHWEKRNPDGTPVLSARDLEENIAHEFGHLGGLIDLGSDELWETVPLEMIDLMYNIMFFQRNYVKSVTAEDVAGMEACTENYTCGEWVPTGEADRCRQCECTTNSGGCSFTKFDTTHNWSSEDDITCNDCGYMRNIEIPIINIGGLLVARIDGQSWVLSDSFPTTFTDLIGYSNEYIGITWTNARTENSPNRYCYNYNGTNIIIGDSNKYHPDSFWNLRQKTKRHYNGISHSLCYILSRKWSLNWYPQYYETEENMKGIFWTEKRYDIKNGHHVVIRRALVDGTGKFNGSSQVWSPELRIPVYFSNESDYQTPDISSGGTIDLSSEIIKSVFVDGYNPEITFMLKWPGSDLDLTLKSPDGTVINPELVLSDPNIDYVETDTYEFYRIFEPASGQWEAMIYAVDVEGEEPYTLEIFGKASEIPVNPTDLALDFPSNIQYSDMLSGKAILTSEGTALQDMEVEFGCMIPQETLITDEAGEVYITPYKVEEASGTSTYPVCVNFYGDDYYLSSYSEQYIIIEKEDASIAYNGDTIVETGTPANLSCKVSEEEDGSPGDITLAGPVTFSLTTEEGFEESYTADIDSDGVAATTAELPAGLYKIAATIDSNYYTADSSKEAILAVYDPEGSFVTGGGWLIPEGSTGKVNFGFEVKYKNDGTLKGNLMIKDHNSGTDYRATDFTYLVISANKAYFSGNLEIDGEGAYSFTATMEDNGSPGKNNDKFSIDILVNGEHIVFNELIDNGNIVIHK